MLLQHAPTSISKTEQSGPNVSLSSIPHQTNGKQPRRLLEAVSEMVEKEEQRRLRWLCVYSSSLSPQASSTFPIKRNVVQPSLRRPSLYFTSVKSVNLLLPTLSLKIVFHRRTLLYNIRNHKNTPETLRAKKKQT